MIIIAGLGNPGPKYQGNRHNIGFMAADEIAMQRKGLTTDLSFLLDKEGVSREIHAKLKSDQPVRREHTRSQCLC